MFATVLLVIGVIVFVVGILVAFVGEDEVMFGGIVTAVVALIATLGIGYVTMVDTVDGKSIGVKVAMGKTSGTLESGRHIHAPWESVEIMDGTKQTSRFEDDNRITAKVSDGINATVNTNFQWRLNLDAAEKMYTDYRGFDTMRDDLVIPAFKTTVNEVLSSYDPVEDVKKDKNKDKVNAGLADQIRERMQEKMGEDITIDTVNIQFIEPGDKTQARIDALGAEKGNLDVAEMRKQTAQREAEANKILSDSLSPDVLSRECLRIAEENGKDLLGCIPGTTGQPIINK